MSNKSGETFRETRSASSSPFISKSMDSGDLNVAVNYELPFGNESEKGELERTNVTCIID